MFDSKYTSPISRSKWTIKTLRQRTWPGTPNFERMAAEKYYFAKRPAIIPEQDLKLRTSKTLLFKFQLFRTENFNKRFGFESPGI